MIVYRIKHKETCLYYDKLKPKKFTKFKNGKYGYKNRTNLVEIGKIYTIKPNLKSVVGENYEDFVIESYELIFKEIIK